MKKYLIIKLIALIIVIMNCNVESSGQIVLDRFTESQYKPILSVNLGFPFGFASEDFFSIYRNELDGKNEYTRHSPTISIVYKTWLTPNFRMGLSANILRSTFSDYYYTSGANFSRNHTQEIVTQTLPIILSGELIPYDKQFRSYIGGGVGINVSNINWEERVNSTYQLDKRKGGLHYSETSLVPAFRMFSGLELGFDEFPESEFLGSIIFELQYTYSFRNPNLFKSIKNQLIEPSEVLNKRIKFLPGYFSFHLGLSLNLDAEKK